MLSLKVINLFGAPGVGKSTLAAALFNLMKSQGKSVELITEYAKDLTYEKNYGSLQNQLGILAQQDLRQRRLEGQVEWVITDSPLPLGIAYMTAEYGPWLTPAVWGAFDRYENYNILVNRGTFIYDPRGRNQTESEALVLDMNIRDIFEEAIVDEEDFALEVTAKPQVAHEVYDWIMDGEEFDGE